MLEMVTECINLPNELIPPDLQVSADSCALLQQLKTVPTDQHNHVNTLHTV